MPVPKYRQILNPPSRSLEIPQSPSLTHRRDVSPVFSACRRHVTNPDGWRKQAFTLKTATVNLRRCVFLVTDKVWHDAV